MNQKYNHGNRPDRVVTIRLTPETHRAIRMLSARADMTVSAFFRAYAEEVTGQKERTTYRDGL